MNVASSAFCTGVLFALGPAVLAAVATVVVLLANWLLSFTRDSNPSS